MSDELHDESKNEPVKLPSEWPDLYRQLFYQCNSDPIALLLDVAKAHSEQAKRAVHKPQGKIDRISELRKAVDASYIGLDHVLKLLRDSEETGQQHVFLYKPRTAKDRQLFRDFSEIATLLFDEHWGSGFFPSFDQPTEGLAFVDFRHEMPGHPRDWLVKAYGHGIKQRTVSRKTEQVDDNTFDEIRRVVREDVRTVMVARWRDPTYLEVRIDRTKSSGEDDMSTRLGAFMELLAPAFTGAQLTAHQLLSVGEQLILERKSKDGKPNPAYTLNSLALLDASDGDLIFRPKEPQQGIDEDEGRARTLEAALSGGAQAVGLNITWLPCDEAPHSLQSPVTTIITGAACNELVFSARIDPEIYDYVLQRLAAN